MSFEKLVGAKTYKLYEFAQRPLNTHLKHERLTLGYDAIVRSINLTAWLIVTRMFLIWARDGMKL